MYPWDHRKADASHFDWIPSKSDYNSQRFRHRPTPYPNLHRPPSIANTTTIVTTRRLSQSRRSATYPSTSTVISAIGHNASITTVTDSTSRYSAHYTSVPAPAINTNPPPYQISPLRKHVAILPSPTRRYPTTTRVRPSTLPAPEVPRGIQQPNRSNLALLERIRRGGSGSWTSVRPRRVIDYWEVVTPSNR